MKTSHSLMAVLLSVGSAISVIAATPFLDVKFQQNTSWSLLNGGSAGETLVSIAPNPAPSANVPFGGGAYAADFGNSGGTGAIDANTGNILNAAKDLKSFTIAGWINARSATPTPSGTRIISWYQSQNNADGVDLIQNSSGGISLGIKQWAEYGVSSNTGKIPIDPNASYNNWRFFAITYDGTVTSDNVKFYFGTSTSPAVLDKSTSYNKGLTGLTIAASIAIGNYPAPYRSSSQNAEFRGLIDEVKIFGSKANASGVLSLSEIQALQGASPIAGQSGVIYERWNGITGSTLASFTSSTKFSGPPDVTLVKPTSESSNDTGDNYGARIKGWIKAPATGTYQFGLTVDDVGDFSLSTNANPDNAKSLIVINSWLPYDSLSKYTATVNLIEGDSYYFESRMKENYGGAHMRISWKKPDDQNFSIIPSTALSTSTDNSDVYPSSYHLYEQGTQELKATMGWKKDDGNSHYYIQSEGKLGLKIQNSSVVIPERLVFGGAFPTDTNGNDMMFQWYRPNVTDIGFLRLECKRENKWAMEIESWSEQLPLVTFNEWLEVTGPEVEEAADEEPWQGITKLHYYDGLNFYKNQAQIDYYYDDKVKTANYDAEGVLIQEFGNGPYPEKQFERVAQIAPGELYLKSTFLPLNRNAQVTLSADQLAFIDSTEDDNGINTTLLQAGRVETEIIKADSIETNIVAAKDYVITKKWKVTDVPDYVFEKGYKLQPLSEVEMFVNKNKHLPNIPSAKDMSEGLSLGELNLQILKSVEELTLHVIALDKELKAQKQKNSELEAQLNKATRGAP